MPVASLAHAWALRRWMSCICVTKRSQSRTVVSTADWTSASAARFAGSRSSKVKGRPCSIARTGADWLKQTSRSSPTSRRRNATSSTSVILLPSTDRVTSKSAAYSRYWRCTATPLRVGSQTRKVWSKRVNSPEANASAPAVMSTTMYSPAVSSRWLRSSSTDPSLEWKQATPRSSSVNAPVASTCTPAASTPNRAHSGLSPVTESSRDPGPGGVVFTITAADGMRGLSPRR